MDTEHVLKSVIIQLIVIITIARLFAWLFRRLRQPAVVGEIAGGLVLGPSVFQPLAVGLGLTWLWQDWQGIIHDASPIFGVMKEIGLILLLFIVGLEFDFQHLRQMGKAALAISLSGIVLPFSMGALLAPWMHHALELKVDPTGFWLFLGTAMSITALPILGRMMIELNVTRTHLGVVTITAAAIDDASAWIILATVAGAVRVGFDPWLTLRMLLLTILFFIGMRFIIRPGLKRSIAWYLQKTDGRLEINGMAVLLILLFLASLATHLIGIFAIFGAFLLGALLSDETRLRETLSGPFHYFVGAFFLPIFFTFTGMRTDVGTLHGGVAWFMAGMVLLMAISGKWGGCALAARWAGFSWREASCIGILMNTRALMELIVINVGFDLGVIEQSVFTMLVFMALITTIMTTPILLWLHKGTELEPWIRQSGFGQPGSAWLEKRGPRDD